MGNNADWTRSRSAHSRGMSRRDLMRRTGQAGLGAGMAALLAGHAADYRALAQDPTVLSLYHDKTGPWTGYLEALGQTSAAEIGVGLEVVPYPDTTSYQSTLLPALQADAPDLFTWWSGFRLEDLVTNGLVADLSQLWTDNIASGNILEGLNAGFTFHGKQYGVPLHVSYWVVFYNKKTFAANNVAPPTTWAEMITLADTFKSAGITPFGATQDGRWPSFIWFEELILRTDPAFYQALTAGQASYTDPPAVAAMQAWQGMIEAGYFTPFDIDLSDGGVSQFASGTLAMIPFGTHFQGAMIGAGLVPEVDYGAFIMPNVNPAVTDKVIINETAVLTAAATGKNLDASTSFLNWFLGATAQTQWGNAINDGMANPTITLQNPTNTAIAQTVVNEGYGLYQRYWEASPVPIVESAVDFLAQFMLNPGDPIATLQQIQDLAAAEWSNRG